MSDMIGGYDPHLGQMCSVVAIGPLGYGKTIKWTEFDGSKVSVETRGHQTAKAANIAAIKMAKEAGWVPPRWWQWWRWSDTRLANSIEPD